MAEHLVVTGLFDVEDLTSEGQDRLILAVATLLGRPACRIALDQKEFAVFGIAVLTIGEFAGQGSRIEAALAPDQLAGASGGVAGACGTGRAPPASRLMISSMVLAEAAKELESWPLLGAGSSSTSHTLR